MSMNDQKRHVAVLPFPFSSHPKLLFNLLLKLANSAPSILFSFFTFPDSDHSLFSSSSSDQLPHNIKIFPNLEDGIPPGHKFSGHPVEPLDLFLASAPQNLTRAIETAASETGIKVTCVLSDSFLTCSGEIAESFNASWISFYIAFPTSLSSHFYTQIIREKCPVLERDQEIDFIPGISKLRVKDLPVEVLCEQESVFSKTLAEMGEKLPKANAVTVNCFQELVPEALNNDLKSKFKTYLNLGFLSMSLPPQQLPESASDQTGCLSWLETQSTKSVVYVSFGTVAALAEKELIALAEALESSKIQFLWSLRDDLTEKLPKGFVERTKQQGKIVPWAPQSSVLAHDSVAVYVTHAGYNSVCESIVYGVPMICRPVLGDNMVNARAVEVLWGIGVTVEDGVLTKNGLLKDLEVFFSGYDERGKKMRENIQELKEVVLMASKPNGTAAADFSKLMDIISMA